MLQIRRIFGLKGLAQYLPLLACALILAYFWKNQSVQNSGSFQFHQSTQFKNNDDPYLFGHLTDIHFDAYDSPEKIIKAFDSIDTYQVDTLLITGDIGNNFVKHVHRLPSGHVFANAHFGVTKKDDYDLYKAANLHSRYTHYIDMPGNHDEFSVYDFNSSVYYFRNYSHIFSDQKYSDPNEFLASFYETDQAIYFMINPYRFPASHATTDMWARPTKAQMDVIKQKALSLKNSDKTVFACSHFPLEYWDWYVKTSDGETIIDVLKMAGITHFLSGHTHPEHGQIMHFNGIVDMIGGDVQDHQQANIVAIDNGQVSHHSFSLDNPPKAIITFPLDYHQMSERSFANHQQTVIRVVGISDDLRITVSGFGDVPLVRKMKSGTFLYEMPIQLQNGFNEIAVTGDIQKNISVLVGDTYPDHVELLASFTNQFFVGDLIAIIFPIYSILFLITVKNLPLKKFMIICQILAFILPISLTTSEGHFGYVSIFGYKFIGHDPVFDPWGRIFYGLWTISVLIPMLHMLYTWSCGGFVTLSILFVIAGYVNSLKYALVAVFECTGFWAMCSPSFIFLPNIMIFVGIAYMIRNKRSKVKTQ